MTHQEEIKKYVELACSEPTIMEAVKKSVPIKSSILDERGVLKDIKGNFVLTMLKADPKVSAAMMKKPKNRSDEEKDLIKRARVDATKRFAFCKKALDNDSDIPYAERLVYKLMQTVQLLRYIGDTSFDDAFAKYGAELYIKPMEDINPEYFSNPDVKTAIKYTLEESIKHDHAVDDYKTDIESTFNNTTKMDFIKTSDNPNGLDKQQFKKLVDAEYLSETDKEKLEKFCNKHISENEGGAVSRTIIAKKLRDI